MSGLRGYKRMVEDEKAGKRLVNRPEWVGRRTRRIRKIMGKSNWFKKKNKTRDPEVAQ